MRQQGLLEVVKKSTYLRSKLFHTIKIINRLIE